MDDKWKILQLIPGNDLPSISFYGRVILVYIIFLLIFSFHSSVTWLYVLLDHCTMYFLWCLTVSCKRFACKVSYALPLFFTEHLSLLILSLTQDSHCSSLNILRLSGVGPSLCECLAGHAILIFPIKFLLKALSDCYIATHVAINNVFFFYIKYIKIIACGEIKSPASFMDGWESYTKIYWTNLILVCIV